MGKSIRDKTFNFPDCKDMQSKSRRHLCPLSEGYIYRTLGWRRFQELAVSPVCQGQYTQRQIHIKMLNAQQKECTYYSKKQKLQDVHLNFVVCWASQQVLEFLPNLCSDIISTRMSIGIISKFLPHIYKDGELEEKKIFFRVSSSL